MINYYTISAHSTNQQYSVFSLALVDDTVIADPLFTVPILVSPADLLATGEKKLSLCYEFHGIANRWFNFITDMCTNVNAHYTAVVADLNIIDQIGVIAVNDDKKSVKIKVNVNGCKAEVEGKIVSQFREKGISVRKIHNRVRIAVPNGAEQRLVMWVTCETLTLTNPDTFEDIKGVQAIRFDVKRGLNFGHVDSHGIIGMTE
jgi:hypothetical protein